MPTNHLVHAPEPISFPVSNVCDQGRPFAALQFGLASRHDVALFFFLAAKQFPPVVYPPKRVMLDLCLQSIAARFSFFVAEKIMELCDREQSNDDGASFTSSNHSRRHSLLRDIDVVRQWTHWDLNPGPSACEADVIPLHHVPAYCQCLLILMG